MTIRFKYLMMALLAGAVSFISCQHEEIIIPSDDVVVKDGYMKISFSASASEPTRVATRGVDIDGGGVNDMTLFCFDSRGIFITTSTANITSGKGTPKGTFDAAIPENTQIVHFLANQNMTNYPEDRFRGMSEAETMAEMEGSSGKMIYWARFKSTAPGQTFKTELEARSASSGQGNLDGSNGSANIVMIRNHAYVVMDNESEGYDTYFKTTAFAIYNTQAFGTVAPFYNGSFPSSDQWPGSVEYVTLPGRSDKVSDVVDVNSGTEIDGKMTFGQYVFECENRQDDPVSVILYGSNTSKNANGELIPGQYDSPAYYRVMLQRKDQNGNDQMVMLRRNHKYVIHITGSLEYGVSSFDEALTAPATNNVWVSITDDISEVMDEDYVLSVAQTVYVMTGPESDLSGASTVNVHYNYKNNTGSSAALTMPDVSWLEGNNVAENSDFDTDADHLWGVNSSYESTVFGYSGYNGQITLTLSPMKGEQKREGTLLIKAGSLQRKIKVVTVSQQEFEPVWVSSQLYGQDVLTSPAHATLMFYVPETTPADLFPMRVLISANKLDIRAASGQQLPLVYKDTKEWWGEKILLDEDGNNVKRSDGKDAEIEYKYVLNVTGPGMQRVYFENILSQGGFASFYIMVEAQHFKPVSKAVTYTSHKYAIESDLKSYVVPGLTSNDDGVAFLLVPQKKNADVSFNLNLCNEEKGGHTALEPNKGNPYITSDRDYETNPDYTYDPDKPTDSAKLKDELLFYSENLLWDAGNGDDVDLTVADGDYWTSNGRVHLMLIDSYGSQENKYKFNLKFVTSTAKSAETVRIASNETGKTYIGANDVEGGLDAMGTYYGRSFRSMVFELANYRPFRFGAMINFNNEENYHGTTTMKDPTDLKKDVSDIREGYIEVTDDVEFEFADVGTPVNVAFDVTSFRSDPSQGAGGDPVTVSPFGSPFEIYIDAPMLTLPNPLPTDWIWDDPVVNEAGQTVEKLRKDPVVPGRFIYTVDASREAERAYGSMSVLFTDTASNMTEGNTNGQTNERRVLPFVTNSIVTAGDIVISSNVDQAVFYQKAFHVKNPSHVGTISVKNDTGGSTEVEAGEFVAVELDSDHTRIASLTVTSKGQYELRLRKEYEFYWTSTINIIYGDYSKTCLLKDIFEDPAILLEITEEKE